ncbi:MAG: hypothetical protein L6Q57_05320 [Alphaproteobacteria bacterium]|nr:hypothetical protein [Alphaproteobacteria bacterium]
MKDLKCPITGVSIPWFLLSVIIGFAFLFGYQYVMHGIWLMPVYELTPQLWRPVAEMQALFPWCIGTKLATVIIIGLIYTRNHEGKGIMEGVRFGVLIGALMGVMMMSSYLWMPISLDLAMKWLAVGFGEGLGLGIIFSLAYRCGSCTGSCAGKDKASCA